MSSCPICGAETDLEAKLPHRPFCSPSCKRQDLANWLEGRYSLPRELTAEDLAELSPEEQSQLLVLLAPERQA